jgi:uncharacterized protein (UPF0335 family)
VGDPFRDDSATAVRIERLEQELAETREAIASVVAAMPENGDAYLRRLEDENRELRADCQRLVREVADLRTRVKSAGGERWRPR